MIARICGKIKDKRDNRLLIDVQGICYEVFIPTTTMQRIDGYLNPDNTIDLITYHYHQVEPSRSTPVLIGFLNEIEKEFFESFITVSGIGPRAALRALNQPISHIAQAIDDADIDFLKSLPGIGQQRAKEIIAKLQGRVGKFGLIQDRGREVKTPTSLDNEEEALSILLQLQYKKQEAKEMLRKALKRNSSIETTQDLLNEVYRQRKEIA